MFFSYLLLLNLNWAPKQQPYQHTRTQPSLLRMYIRRRCVSHIQISHVSCRRRHRHKRKRPTNRRNQGLCRRGAVLNFYDLNFSSCSSTPRHCLGRHRHRNPFCSSSTAFISLLPVDCFPEKKHKLILFPRLLCPCVSQPPAHGLLLDFRRRPPPSSKLPIIYALLGFSLLGKTCTALAAAAAVEILHPPATFFD